MTRSLVGARVLLVEDEFLIALMAEEMLAELGATVAAQAADVERALALVREQPVDAALVDLNLGGERGEPIAAALRTIGTPFVIATGYGAAIKDNFGAPVLEKPYTQEQLASAFAAAFEGAAHRGA